MEEFVTEKCDRCKMSEICHRKKGALIDEWRFNLMVHH